MKLKKILAVMVAAALAAVSLPQAASAAEPQVESTDEIQAEGTDEIQAEGTEEATTEGTDEAPAEGADKATTEGADKKDNMLHWTLTAESTQPITVRPGESSTPSEQPDDPYTMYTVKFDLAKVEGVDVKEMPKNLIYVFDIPSYSSESNKQSVYHGTTPIQKDGDNYKFMCPVLTSIVEDETVDYSVTAFLPLGNTIAELKVDLTSDKIQSFTTENNRTVKIEKEAGTSGNFYLELYNSMLGNWNIAELNTFSLPVRDSGYNYTFHINVDAGQQENYSFAYDGIKKLSVSEDAASPINVNLTLPDTELKNITIKLDTSELSEYKSISVSSQFGDWEEVSYREAYAGTALFSGFGVHGTLYSDEIQEIPAIENYDRTRVTVTYESGDIIEYNLSDSLKDGEIKKLGTVFTNDDLQCGYSTSTIHHPGDTVYFREGGIRSRFDESRTDGNENYGIFLYTANDVTATFTFTNVEDEEAEPIVVEATGTGLYNLVGNGGYEVKLPEGMDGKYNVKLYIEYESDVTKKPAGSDPGADTPPSVDNPGDSTDDNPGGSTNFPPAFIPPAATTTPAETEPEAAGTDPAPADTTVPAATTVSDVQPTSGTQQTDEKTGVKISAEEGVLPEGATLNVELGKTTVGILDNLYVLDITIVDELTGEKIQPNGNVTVTIPVPQNLFGASNYYIYYQADDGTLVNMHATYANGYVTFTTNHFSTYILSTEKLVEDDSTSAPTGGSDNPHTGVVLAIVPALAATAALVISKKRK